MLTVRCPECGASLKAPPDAVGKRAKCKGCRKSFVVTPAPLSDPDTLTANALTSTSVMPAVVPIVSPAVAPSTVPVPAPAAAPVASPASVPDFTAFARAVAEHSESAATPAGTSSTAPSTPRRRRKRGGLGAFGWIMIVMAAAAIGMLLWHFRPRETDAPPQVVDVPPQTTGELDTLQLKLGMAGREGSVQYDLIDAPAGVKVNAATGELTWTPTEEQGPGEYEFSVAARTKDSKRTIATAKIAVTVEERSQPPVIEDVDVVEAVPGVAAKVTIKASDADLPASPLTFALSDKRPPEGASINANTGELTWTPESGDAGEVVNIAVRVTKAGEKPLSSDCLVSFRVAGGDSPVEKLAARFREKGGDVGVSSGKGDFDIAGKSHLFHFGTDELWVFAFESDAEAELAAESLREPEKAAAVAKHLKKSVRVYRSAEFVAVYPGEAESTLTVIEAVLGKPFAESKYVAEAAASTTRDPSDEALIALYNERDKRQKLPTPKILSPQEFPALRKIFAERFEKEHEADLRRGFGDEYDDMLKWLNERVDFKESLFLAFDPQHDDIGAGLALVKELRKQFPKQIDKYLSLVVATAVVWDREGQGIYDYAHHARRTGSTMPDGLLAAIDNFKYLVDAEEQMQGRIRYVPWEFLTHVVNHRTPLPERQWTLANYVARRPMFGKTYSDVPYDTEMLRTNSQVCKLGGKEYTLPNILQFGGVCAMQADFAARVGKGLGVPSEYVRGASASGDLHAWIMWVEITAATPANVSFTLESHGRYLGDHYYVGQLNDPQTGVEMTDRDLERRLHSVGTNSFAKRQADLAMRAFPMLRDELKLDRNDQLAYLGQVTRLCPWNEPAWAEAAKLAGDRDLDKRGRTQMLATLNQLFTTFAHLPDYTLTVFPDLVQFEPDVKTRIKHYYKLLDVYAAAKRPDLAFDGLLILSDILVENERSLEAIQALAATVKKYADQGHYVPKMLDRLEILCDKPEHKAALITFYSEFLPLIPQKRGNESSKYCMKMYERGIRKFTEAGNTQQAQLYQSQLQKLRTGN